MEKFQQYREVAGEVTYALKRGDVNTYLLTAGVNKAATAPTGARYALFSSDADTWVKIGGTAAVPVGDTTDGSGSELNPVVRRIESGVTIGLISEYAAKVSISYYE
jgi:hypothetical protein